MRHLYGHLCFPERFSSEALDFCSGLRLHFHARKIFYGKHNVDLFAPSPSRRSSHYIETQGWWQVLEGSCLLCILTTAVFPYQSGYSSIHHPRQEFFDSGRRQSLWNSNLSRFSGLTCAVTGASFSGNSHVLIVKSWILVHLSSPLRGHVEQDDMFELLEDSCYDMDLRIFGQSRSGETNWSCWGSLLFPYNFNTGLVGCVEGKHRARSETSKRLNDAGKLQSLGGSCHLCRVWRIVPIPCKVANAWIFIKLVSCHFWGISANGSGENGKNHWAPRGPGQWSRLVLGPFDGCPSIGSCARIRGDWWGLCEVFLAISESVPFPFVSSRLLIVRHTWFGGHEKGVLPGSTCQALESTLPSKNKLIRELDS